jgi:hypothetical protein
MAADRMVSPGCTSKLRPLGVTVTVCAVSARGMGILVVMITN